MPERPAHTRVLSVGGALPATRLSNDELARRLAARGVVTSDEWIRTRTGIAARWLAAPGETTLELARRAAAAALERAGLSGPDLDLILVATTTPDLGFPSTACRLQEALGGSAAAFDLQAVCAGFVYALACADAMLRAGPYRRALVVGAEVLSRVLDWDDRSTCVLFGDGAGAVTLELSERPGILAHRLRADGRCGADTLALDGHLEGGAWRGRGFITMDGPRVFRLAVSQLVESARETLALAGLSAADLDWLVPHQANRRIISMVAEKLGVPPERTVYSLTDHGNTSAASVPLALDDLRASGRLRPGDLILLQGIGAGMAWGSVLLRW